MSSWGQNRPIKAYPASAQLPEDVGDVPGLGFAFSPAVSGRPGPCCPLGRRGPSVAAVVSCRFPAVLGSCKLDGSLSYFSVIY